MRYSEPLNRPELTITTFLIHLEPVEPSGIAWWAEAPEISGLSIAAPSLKELRQLIDEAAAIHLAPGAEIKLTLVVPDPEPAASPVLHGAVATPTDTGLPTRSQFLPLVAA